MNFEGQPFKTCLFPTHFQWHLLLFACSVVGKMKKRLPNGGFFMVLYPGKKGKKNTVNQTNINCLNAGRTHVLFLMLKTASVMRRYRMNLVHFSIVHDQSHSPFLDGVPAKNRCYAQGCHDPMFSYEPSLSSTCALSTCWLLDEAVVRFIFKKV